jgi:ABC-type sugar transport system ATPase subunit
MPASVHRLETIALRKEYPGTVALDDVSLQFEGGRIHALLGKNGAGKSTLLKILAGAVLPSSGTVRVNDKPVQLHSPREALARGIAAVHQELSLVPEMTVAENILLGQLPTKKRGRMIDWKEVNRRAAAVLQNLGVIVDVRVKARSLGVAQQQLVEIAKAMSHSPAVLMLDEPTSALAYHETERLFALLRTLARQGVVVLYITHRLEEIRRIADAVTILRNGRVAGTLGIAEASPAAMVQMMFGETVEKTRPPVLHDRRERVLEVRGFTRKGAFVDVSFELFAGEILGLAGLLGSGRTELLRALFGADPHDSGVVYLAGIPVQPSSPVQMRRMGVALAPENRKEEGLIQTLSTRTNLCLASLGRIARLGFLTAGRERTVATRSIREVAISLPSVDASIGALSGGNQQKVVVAKWLNIQPRVILLDEPTRGIDVQAKQQMYELIRNLSAQGIATIVVSSELEELLDICHRILIMKQGVLTGEILPQQSSLEHLFTRCMS